jgi:hypothetical protein
MPPPADFDALCELQHGVVSRGQLLGLGHTDDWIEARLRSGRWQRVFTGTYATFSGQIPYRARVTAAVLRAGPGAMARARTAAALYGLADQPPDRPIQVLVPATRRVSLEPGIEARYSRDAAARRHPLWTPARTWIEDAVLDLAQESASLADVTGWVSRAVGRGLTTPDRIRAALQDRRRQRWRPELTAILADVSEGARSPLEVRYLRRVERAHALPRGVRQRRVVAGRSVRYVDIDHDEFSTRIELDGRMGHADDGAFRDRRRDNDGVRTGHATLRYGWAEVVDSPCAVAAEVSQVLRDRGWTGQAMPCGASCKLADGS